MKKNISINISGIIFHIEEDGYEQLKSYLESINRYFSSFDDSLEIIADIESRIAEIFLAKLKDGQQVVTIEDVESLIATMGSIKDFQAAEEDATIYKDTESEPEGDKAHPLFSQKLYRDKNRKLIAGVLAGIAHYFSIDPLWIRLVYITLFLGISILPSWGGILFISYIVLWIIIPESDELVEIKKIKKMFRDPDHKVLGGVASGIAAYFGVDMIIIRLLFFISIFFAGSGLILYLILWLILPEAKTLTDKMEMQGEPVTLSNIEQNIRKSLNMESGEENVFMKVLLFPFRIIAVAFEFLSKAMGPFMVFLMEAARIIGGILLIILGVSGILTVLLAIGVAIGTAAEGDFYMLFNIPFDVIKQDIQIVPLIALSLFIIIPMLMIALLGFSAVMRKSVIRAKFSLPLLAIWIISIIIMALVTPKYIKEFRREGKFSLTNEYNLQDKTIQLNYRDTGPDQLEALSLKFKGYDGKKVKIEQTFKAMGSDRRKAIENARKVIYHISAEDSVFVFDSNMNFMKDAKYRKQGLDITVYMPRGQKFILDPELRHLMGTYMYRQGYSNSQIDGNTWMFDNKGLICISCPNEDTNISDEKPAKLDIKGPTRTIEVEDFTEITSSSPFRFIIKKSDHFEVVLNGKKDEMNQIEIDRTEETLSVDYKKSVLNLNPRKTKVTIYILMPELYKIDFGGASKSFITGFNNDQIEVSLKGAASSEIAVDTKQLFIDQNGASKLKLSGSGRHMEAELSGASSMYAFSFEANEIEIDINNASTAKVNATDQLTVQAKGSSKLQYHGNPKIEITKSAGSSVKKNDY